VEVGRDTLESRKTKYMVSVRRTRIQREEKRRKPRENREKMEGSTTSSRSVDDNEGIRCTSEDFCMCMNEWVKQRRSLTTVAKVSSSHSLNKTNASNGSVDGWGHLFDGAVVHAVGQDCRKASCLRPSDTDWRASVAILNTYSVQVL
jgi:hypothetical protein